MNRPEVVGVTGSSSHNPERSRTPLLEVRESLYSTVPSTLATGVAPSGASSPA